MFHETKSNWIKITDPSTLFLIMIVVRVNEWIFQSRVVPLPPPSTKHSSNPSRRTHPNYWTRNHNVSPQNRFRYDYYPERLKTGWSAIGFTDPIDHHRSCPVVVFPASAASAASLEKDTFARFFPISFRLLKHSVSFTDLTLRLLARHHHHP